MTEKKSEDVIAIRCYNKPGITTTLQARYTAEGLFIADFDSGWSLSSEQVPSEDHRPAAGRAFNRIMEISRNGGLGVIRTPNDDDEIITVGRWEPNCATFRKANGKELKGIQMSEFGLFVPDDDLYSDLDSEYHNGNATVGKADVDLIKTALDVLEREGRLRKPSYL
ncbi:hypothetical protein [Haloarcula hispanica]|uniref:Uncharacterized protein n=1 Tax=Haloarcula hispanica pleomorphic virus 3 TaxID=1879051 RepID=A0A1C8V5Y9_9VIRU|nr:hypothetical protein [Haloarcula hispanica]YP_009798571.1 putative protein 8 [Haloarcula hispanica pleomorphic virus 3]ANW09669.1 putative protein 8 [Haloarcula hispanica pleomorphic virus 3]QRG24205.1 hypothetical protein HarHp1_040 [Haloarcula virus Harhisp1]